MRFISMLLALLGAVFLSSQALAETWVDTGHVTYIDVDSIQRGPDGLIYYMQKYKYHPDFPPQRAAVDCVRRLAYSSYDLEYTPGWRSLGKPVSPVTMGEELLDFVCSRVR